LSVTDLFVRGSVIRYVLVPPEEVDTGLLQDAARREAMESAKLAGAGAGGSRR
jgi:U6 snRNA-associated Sm-like protein LSm2